ncbi:hypothetical protein [Oleiharenicola lentus]|uniref:hypothetical protein n=1 Tax=Oleiharenicola lentus TaxID=2508720 RepID=UPI003F680DB7
MLPPDQRPKVTLENLLQLKRAERPAEEFWSTFERELRQKQLTALMEKRPWWQSLPIIFNSRAYFPVGATAILAFTLVSVKFYSPSESAQLDGSMISVAQENRSNSDASAQPSGDIAPIAVPELSNNAPVSAQSSQPLQVASIEVPVSTSAQVEVPMLAASTVIETPSARSIAANLARLEQSEPELIGSVLGSRLSPVARVQTAALQTEEFASVPTGDSKRTRLLAQYSDRQLQPQADAPATSSDRLNRRLDAELNDRITRVGLRGDQVSLKF